MWTGFAFASFPIFAEQRIKMHWPVCVVSKKKNRISRLPTAVSAPSGYVASWLSRERSIIFRDDRNAQWTNCVRLHSFVLDSEWFHFEWLREIAKSNHRINHSNYLVSMLNFFLLLHIKRFHCFFHVDICDAYGNTAVWWHCESGVSPQSGFTFK